MCKESEKIIVLCYTEYGDNMTKNDRKWMRRNRDTIFFVLAGFVLFILLLVLYFTNLYQSLDSSMASFVLTIRSSFLTTILLLISNLIGTYFLVIPLFLIILLLKFRDRLSELPAIIVSLVAVNGFGFSLKTFFHRMRPVFDLVTETGYSFPSMHTYNGVMIYGILILILKRYYPSSWYRNGAIVLFVILMFLTGFSRIYLSVHYTSDVLTGFALGLISLGVLSYFMKKR